MLAFGILAVYMVKSKGYTKNQETERSKAEIEGRKQIEDLKAQNNQLYKTIDTLKTQIQGQSQQIAGVEKIKEEKAALEQALNTDKALRDKFLASFGGGIRVRLYKNLFCRFEWAKDVGSKPTAGSGPSTFHFSVQSEL